MLTLATVLCINLSLYSCSLSYKLGTCDRPVLVYKAPVICPLLLLFQFVSHYFGTSSITWRRPCQIDAVFKGTDHFRCCWSSRITCEGNMTFCLFYIVMSFCSFESVAAQQSTMTTVKYCVFIFPLQHERAFNLKPEAQRSGSKCKKHNLHLLVTSLWWMSVSKQREA